MKYLVLFIFIFSCSCSIHDALNPMEGASQCKDFEFALKRASKIRGLEPKERALCKILDKKEFKSAIRDTVLRDIELSQLKYEEIILKLIGMIPQDYDYESCFVDALTSQAIAFYDSHSNFFVIPSWVNTPIHVLVHEATHALDNQYFLTKNFFGSKFLFTDKNLALWAFNEGSAGFIEEYYLSQLSKDNLDKELERDLLNNSFEIDKHCRLPDNLSDLFNKIYSYGLNFNKKLYLEDGLKSLNQAFSNPPIRTSEIIQPKSYLNSSKQYQSVEIPKSSYLDSRLIMSDTFGQMMVEQVLDHFSSIIGKLSPKKNYLGDSFAFYENKLTYEFVWSVIWLSEDDARLFESIYRNFVKDSIINYHRFNVLTSGSKVKVSFEVLKAPK